MNRLRQTPSVALLGVLLASICLHACAIDEMEPESSFAPTIEPMGSIHRSLPADIDPGRQYVFYIHGAIIEVQGANAVSPQFGAYEFDEILNHLANAGFLVIGEIRSAPTDSDEYSEHLAAQVRALLAQGVPGDHVTIVGFSKGAAITILTSAKLNDPELNFVLIAICGDEMNDASMPEISGRILSLYEKSDSLGSTCKPLADRSSGVSGFDEIEFTTGKQHGAFYSADSNWLSPLISWIREVDS